jgi:hypothetical protein
MYKRGKYIDVVGGHFTAHIDLLETTDDHMIFPNAS